MSAACKECGGRGLIPLPRWMSPGFYRFMAPGCVRDDTGALLMLCGCVADNRKERTTKDTKDTKRERNPDA